ILVGRHDVVQRRLGLMSLRMKIGEHFELVDPEHDARFRKYWQLYHSLMERKGVSPDFAKSMVRTRNTVIAALMLRQCEADAMLCGTVGQSHRHLRHVVEIIGLAPGVTRPAALSAVVLPKGTHFLCDTYVNEDPTPEQLCQMTIRAAEA